MRTLRDVLQSVLMPVDQSLLAGVRAEVVRQAELSRGAAASDSESSEPPHTDPSDATVAARGF